MATIHAQLEFECPCGAKVVVGSESHDTPEGIPEGSPVILHVMPMCEEYRKLEPDEYLRWVRLTIDGRRDA
ncbi:hypothetical protein LCGC14_3140460 [marine sediment metagenome]|uniref:Uncharacterized protein n=1 Tax=marine sediment metagenome TaxID=412755 RepID=A0A0F8Y411_9ZZZZ